MPPTMSRPHINGRLYVDDMALGTEDADLHRHFERYGDVADIFIPKCRQTGAPRCCSFVQFSSPRDAGRALADPRHVINGRQVYIARARPRYLEKSRVLQPNTSLSPAMSKLYTNGRLYIDDMAPGTDDVDLRSHFSRYGDVADIFIPTYRLTGQPRCSAFVHFSYSGDAAHALADPCHVINGQEVYIARARPRHLEHSTVYQYKPLCERRVRDGPWHGYRVGDIGKASLEYLGGWGSKLGQTGKHARCEQVYRLLAKTTLILHLQTLASHCLVLLCYRGVSHATAMCAALINIRLMLNLHTLAGASPAQSLCLALYFLGFC